MTKIMTVMIMIFCSKLHVIHIPANYHIMKFESHEVMKHIFYFHSK